MKIGKIALVSSKSDYQTGMEAAAVPSGSDYQTVNDSMVKAAKRLELMMHMQNLSAEERTKIEQVLPEINRLSGALHTCSESEGTVPDAQWPAFVGRVSSECGVDAMQDKLSSASAWFMTQTGNRSCRPSKETCDARIAAAQDYADQITGNSSHDSLGLDI